MATIRMHLHHTPFDRLKRGQKSMEARVNDVKRQCINVGDEIEFVLLEDDSESVTKIVTALSTFRTFSDLYNVYPKDRDDEAVQYYTDTDIEKFGVVAIELR